MWETFLKKSVKSVKKKQQTFAWNVASTESLIIPS